MELLKREPPSLDPGPLAAILDEGRDLMLQSLKKAGVEDKMIERLKAFDDFGGNSGLFLIATLKQSHKSMFLSSIELEAEKIYVSEKYLRNETLPSREKIEWMRAYNEMSDILGKNYERILMGVQAMAKMMPKEEGKNEKKKPGFRPLVSAQKTAKE